MPNGVGGRGPWAAWHLAHLGSRDAEGWGRPQCRGGWPRADPDLPCSRGSTPPSSWTTPAAPRSRCAAAPTSAPSCSACERPRRPTEAGSEQSPGGVGVAGGGGRPRRRKPAGTARVGTTAQPSDGPTTGQPREGTCQLAPAVTSGGLSRSGGPCWAAIWQMFLARLRAQEYLLRLGEAWSQVHVGAVAVMDREARRGSYEETQLSTCSAFLPRCRRGSYTAAVGRAAAGTWCRRCAGGRAAQTGVRSGLQRSGRRLQSLEPSAGFRMGTVPCLTELPEHTARVPSRNPSTSLPRGLGVGPGHGTREPVTHCPWQAWRDSQ